MKTEFEDFMGNFAGGKKQAKKIMANSPMKAQLAKQNKALQAARLRQKIQKKQLKLQQINESAQTDPSMPDPNDPNYDPSLDPNYDPSLDPNYDPSLDPSMSGEYYDPNMPEEYYDPNAPTSEYIPYSAPNPLTNPNIIPPVQTKVLTPISPTTNYFRSYGDYNMNSQFFAKSGKKGSKSKTTTINTRTGLGGKAVRGIIEEFNKNSAQIFSNQQELKKIDNEMAKAQAQADAQREQMASTMAIAQSAIDVAGSAAGGGSEDLALTDYLTADGAQPSFVPTMVGDNMSEILADENFMEYDEYLGDDDFDEYDDEDGDDFDEYDDADEFDDGEDYDEYDDGEDYDEYDDGEEFDEDGDYDEYDDGEDYDEFLGAAKRHKRAKGRRAGMGGGMRKANRQAKRQARLTGKIDLRAQRQLARKQKLLMKAGRKKLKQQKKLMKRQKQLVGKQKKVASRRQKLRKIMQADPNIRRAVMQGESTCSLFNKLNACALPPSLWRWRDCGMNLAPRQKMIADKFNKVTYGEYDDSDNYDGVDDNVFDCSCSE